MTYQSEQINELMAALSKAQGEMTGAAKDSQNPFFKNRYADLASVWAACREPLSKHGLAVAQTMQVQDGDQYLVTTLGHSSGQWMASKIPVRVEVKDKGANALQCLGIAYTYLRRYALAAMVGVFPDEDVDGQGANGYQASQPTQQKMQISPANVLVTDTQAAAVHDLIQQCKKETQDKIWTFLEGPEIGIQALKDLTVQKFHMVTDMIQKRIAHDAAATKTAGQ